MSDETAGSALLCPNGHQNPGDSDSCEVCGLPAFDVSAQIEQLLGRMSDRAALVARPITGSFIGLGSAGRRMLQNLNLAYGHMLPNASYLAVDSLEGPDASSRIEGRRIRYYRIGDAQKEGLTYCGLAEQAVLRDRRLDYHLRRAGVRKADPRQGIVMVGGVGGGTASGAAAHVIDSCRAVNPQVSTVALLVTPSGNEADHVHFNAFYGVSRLLPRDSRSNTDMIWLVNYDKLRRTRGIGRSGEELTLEGLISYLMHLLGVGLSQSGFHQMIRLSRVANIQTFVPCLAIGRSMEIFGSLPNVLESAVSFPLAEIDLDHVLASYLLLRIPDRLSADFPDGRVAEEFFAWNKRHVPAVKTSMVQIVRSQERSDRVDACVLLGGDRLERSVGDTAQGFRRFRAYLEESAQWETCGLSQERILEAEGIVAGYDGRMRKFRESQVKVGENPV